MDGKGVARHLREVNQYQVLRRSCQRDDPPCSCQFLQASLCDEDVRGVKVDGPGDQLLKFGPDMSVQAHYLLCRRLLPCIIPDGDCFSPEHQRRYGHGRPYEEEKEWAEETED
jgi:hypothetical protein